MSTVDNDRPPYVVFERRAIEDRTASIAAGHYCSKDIDMAIITRPGSRDNLEKEARVWLSELREKARQQMLPPAWYDAFNSAYESWKKGEELPENGIAIKGWPVLSPAVQKDLIASGIRTVEDLANLPDGELGTIGTGAVSYKQKAIAWLDAAKDKGKVIEQVAALSTQVAELVSLTKAQATEIQNLRAQLPKPPVKV